MLVRPHIRIIPRKKITWRGHDKIPLIEMSKNVKMSKEMPSDAKSVPIKRGKKGIDSDAEET